MNSAAKVQIAYVHQNVVTHSFHHSMMSLTNASSHILMPYNLAARGNTMALPEARNELMRYFLEDTDATHIWWIDTDMGFAPDTVEMLLDTELDVVGALTYGNSEYEPDGLGGYKTTSFMVAYDFVKQQDGFMHYTLKHDVCLNGEPQLVAATGTGCLLVSREAAAKVHASHAYAWFDQVAYPGITPVARISEDLSFCYRLSTVGIPIYVHTGVRTNHMKNVWLSS